jgi:hypothetical protein
MEMIRERGIVLEICPTSNLNTRVVSGWDEFRWIFDTFRRNEVRFTINTDGPEMLKTYIRDELATLGAWASCRRGQEQAAATSLAASFVPNVSDVPAAASSRPARVVEREEACGDVAVPVGRSVDPIRAAAVSSRDMRLALDIGAEQLTEEVELRLACGGVLRGHSVDGAIPFHEPDDPVRTDDRLCQVALLVLDDGKLARALTERGVWRQPLSHPLTHPVVRQSAPLLEDIVHERLVSPMERMAASRPAGEAVVVRREEVLGRLGHVVHVARPPDAVADGLTGHQAACLQRVQLLEDAGPAEAEGVGELFGRARAVMPQADEDLASQGRCAREGSPRRSARRLGRDGARVGHGPGRLASSGRTCWWAVVSPARPGSGRGGHGRGSRRKALHASPARITEGVGSTAWTSTSRRALPPARHDP